MSAQTTTRTAAARRRRRRAAALTLGLAAAAAGLAAAWPGAARADNSRGMGTKALVDEVPRGGTGWNNGPAALAPRGGGKYRVEHGAAPAGDVGAGWPGIPVIIDNADGNPVIEHRPPAR